MLCWLGLHLRPAPLTAEYGFYGVTPIPCWHCGQPRLWDHAADRWMDTMDDKILERRHREALEKLTRLETEYHIREISYGGYFRSAQGQSHRAAIDDQYKIVEAIEAEMAKRNEEEKVDAR